jgi:hypothetical protein
VLYFSLCYIRRVIRECRDLVTLGELLRGGRWLRHSSRDQCCGALCDLICA